MDALVGLERQVAEMLTAPRVEAEVLLPLAQPIATACAHTSEDPRRATALILDWFTLLRRLADSLHPADPLLIRPWPEPFLALGDALEAAAQRIPPLDPMLSEVRRSRQALAQYLHAYHLGERVLREIWAIEGGNRPGHMAQAELFTLLACQGRGREITHEGLAEAYASIGPHTNMHRHVFIDHVEAGRSDEAAATWQQLPVAERRLGLIRFYRGALHIQERQARHTSIDASWVRRLIALLRRSPERWAANDLEHRLALATGEPIAQRLGLFYPISHSQLIALTPLEDAARTGHWDRLADMVSQRRAVGLQGPLDDVLMAIGLWQAGDADAAAAQMAGAQAAAMRSGQIRRVDQVLRTYARLGPTELFALGRRIAGQAVPAMLAGGELAGNSPAILRVNHLIARFAVIDVPVLISGPTGVGKEMVARQLHMRSPRARRPFVACNCAAVSGNLLESELFGHVRGAFTGADRARPGLVEEAEDGTLLLDEIGDASPAFQAALLRLLDHEEYRPVGSSQLKRSSCRFVCATNVDLDAAVAAGRFRADLSYRLRRLEITIPPLAERPEDVVPIASRLLLGIDSTRRLAGDAGPWLRTQAWPGNGRELKGLLERVCALEPGPLVTAAHLAAALPHRPTILPLRAAPQPPAMLANTLGLGALERRLAGAAAHLAAHGTLSRKDLAVLMGISPGTATTYLRLLCERGQVLRIEPNASPSSHRFRWLGRSG